MTLQPNKDKFEQKKRELLERRAQQAKAAETTKPAQEVVVDEGLTDVVPEVDNDSRSRSDRFSEEDSAMAGLSILAVYTALTGVKPEKSGGTGEVLVFCPAADHPNTNSEAACLNTRKNTWVCYGQCDDGGGIVDLVAANMGLPFGKNLKGADYAKAKEQLLVEFCGWERVKEGNYTVAKSPAQIAREEKEFEERHSQPRALEVVKPLKETGEESESSGIKHAPVDALPEISNILDHFPEGSPVWEYISATEHTNSPKEFDLFNALGLIGLAVGPYLRGQVGPAFKPGMFILRIARSGTGKSISESPMREILEHIALKWQVFKPGTGERYANHLGAKILTPPGSGEALLDELSKDYADGESVAVRDVKGWLPVDEFRSFIGKSQIKSSTLLPMFLEIENRTGVDDKIEAVSRNAGRTVAINPQLLFTSTIQPNVFRDLVGSSYIDNGMLSRFELVTGNALRPEDEVPLWENVPKDLDPTKEAYAEMYSFYENLRTPNPFGRELLFVRMDSSAQSTVTRLVQKMRRLEQSDNGTQSRFVLKLCKYALLFALNRQSKTIESEDFENAEWILEYLARTTDFADEKVSQTQGTEIEEKILSAIRYHYTKEQGYATASVIKNFIKASTKGWDMTIIVKTLKSLEEGGLIEQSQSSARRGKPSPRYVPLPTNDWNEPRSPKAIKDASK